MISPGFYLVELWGAEGGRGLWNSAFKVFGGKGAYVSATLLFTKRTHVFLNVGTRGGNAVSSPNTAAIGGWNGGGYGGRDLNDDDASGAGGGATDLRVGDNALESRIMVAAGGSGSTGGGYGAPGGDEKCYTITQLWNADAISGSVDGCSATLGQGQNGINHGWTPSSGAGGGYYGGKAVSGGDGNYPYVSYGGNSYIATNSTLSNYGIILFEKEMLSGNLLLPSVNSDSYEKGHPGDGHARITPLSDYNVSVPIIISLQCKIVVNPYWSIFTLLII